MLKIFVIIVFFTITAYSNVYKISARHIGPTDHDRNVVVEKLLLHPEVQKYITNGSYHVISAELIEAALSTQLNYKVYVHNYVDQSVLLMTGDAEFLQTPSIELTPEDLPASPEEFAAATDIVKSYPDFSSEDFIPYEPMPSTVVSAELLRNMGAPRIISVGINSIHSPEKNEIVGVNLATQEIMRFESKAPPTSLATEAVCGLDNAGQPVTGKGRAGAAEIEVKDDSGNAIWNFIVVRPSSSEGSKGSGLELRDVFYKGELILTRAHTPILNVQYAGNRCGPYRDWSYAENYFIANGNDITTGIRMATEKPTTIFDTNSDRGNFRGVALYQDAEKILLVTEISAGWYRYASQFELYNDGTIKPYFQFSAVKNSCVCYSHNHHVYWRFDFDINGINNSVAVYNGDRFQPLQSERSMNKSSEALSWRITNSDSRTTYDITPGKDDGEADHYSVADTWFLRYQSNEIDDELVRTSTRASLNSFINNENILDENFVMWYSGHYSHTHEDRSDVDATVGPVINRSR
jgi:hypothetical protein